MNRNTTKPDDQDRLDQRLGDLVERVLHEHRGVVRHLHVDVLGQRGPDPLHLRVQPVRHLDLVDADQRPDAEVDRLLLVVLGDEVGLFGAQLDPGHVAESRTIAPFRSATIRFLNSSAERRSVLASRLTCTRLPLVWPTAAR